MRVLTYKFSPCFEDFFKEMQDSLALEIVFLPMSEHPNQAQYGKAHGTTLLSEDGRILRVFLNPDCFDQYPADVRDNVAESIAVFNQCEIFQRVYLVC